MADKRILAFNGTSITALRWQSGLVTTDQLFGADALGQEAFSAYLDSAKDSLFYVLADVSEEGFQLETIPYVQGSDRDALIKRRLGQFFFGTPYSLGLSLGRQKDGRRDESVLFAALTRPESLTPWLELIQKSARPLVGIYSVPLVLAENAQQLVSGHQQFLLVTMAANGLRHTFFSGGKIQFSRLSQLTSHNQEEFALTCVREATRTHQYLLGQRMIARNTTMQTFVLAHPDNHIALRAAIADTDRISFELLDLVSLAKKVKLKTPTPDSHCDALFAHQLVTHTPKAQFAPAIDRKQYRLTQIRFGLRAAAFAILFGCLLFAARIGMQWKDLQENAVVTNSQAAADNKRHAALIDELPKIKLTPDNLRAVIARYQELTQRSGGMTPLLAHLSAALEAMPTITLQRLEWNMGKVASTPAQSSPVGSPAAKAPLVATQPQVTTTLLVVARLPISTALDQRLQLETVDALVARLRTDSIQVSIVKSPVDIESGKALKRNSAETARPTGPPEFTIQLTTSL